MTPAEVIAMRDKLSAVIEESKLATWPVDIADMLIGSGWVTNEPKENVLDCKREEENK